MNIIANTRNCAQMYAPMKTSSTKRLLQNKTLFLSCKTNFPDSRERERERDRQRNRERESVFVCLPGLRKRGRERQRERERESICVCVCVYLKFFLSCLVMTRFKNSYCTSGVLLHISRVGNLCGIGYRSHMST